MYLNSFICNKMRWSLFACLEDLRLYALYSMHFQRLHPCFNEIMVNFCDFFRFFFVNKIGHPALTGLRRKTFEIWIIHVINITAQRWHWTWLIVYFDENVKIFNATDGIFTAHHFSGARKIGRHFRLFHTVKCGMELFSRFDLSISISMVFTVFLVIIL